MKRLLFGTLFTLLAILATGCVGNAPEQVIGTWQYVPINNPAQVHPSQWVFTDNGKFYYYDLSLGIGDTGTYDIYANGDGRFIKINNIALADPQIEVSAEWEIVNIDFSNMVVGTKDFGGFIQRDLVKL